MGNVTSPAELVERRRERQRAKTIAELERQANAYAYGQPLLHRTRRRYSFVRILLVLLVIATGLAVLAAGKILSDLAMN